MTNESLLTFPCEFTIKVFGLAGREFESMVLGIIEKHAANPSVQSKLSENGKYCALSVTIQAESKAQLDQIYHDLSSSQQVLMAL